MNGTPEKRARSQPRSDQLDWFLLLEVSDAPAGVVICAAADSVLAPRGAAALGRAADGVAAGMVPSPA
ncbi:MAG: hypothetical protein H7242_07965 [Microbacteriaceae bacterium]|nr:hypothetical protein [Burkholderiaceae bacterium]